MATISSLLRDHVTLQVRSVDRLFVQAYVPRLMTAHQVVRFLLDRGFLIPSPTLLAKQGRACVQAIDRFAAANDILVARFVTGESKEQFARPYRRAAEQELRGGADRRRPGEDDDVARLAARRIGRSLALRVRQAVFVNHYYFHNLDPDWGPAFIKTCSYAPFPVWLYLNGDEWAKRQAAPEGVAFEALDNGFRAAADAAALAAATRPAPPAAQRPDPPRPSQPPLPADPRRTPTRRVLHQDLRADREPLTRRTGPRPAEPIARRTALGRPWREFEQALTQRIAAATLTART